MKNANATAVKREEEEDWGKARPVWKRTLLKILCERGRPPIRPDRKSAFL
jgi:hypothetical protein